jgi:hypothetical protein
VPREGEGSEEEEEVEEEEGSKRESLAREECHAEGRRRVTRRTKRGWSRTAIYSCLR